MQECERLILGGAPGGKELALVGRGAPVNQHGSHPHTVARKIRMELGRFQHGQALGGEHDMKDRAWGSQRCAQLGKALAALEKRGANFLIAPVHGVIIRAAAVRHPAHQRAEFIGFLAPGE